ncbi:hypothetical protein AMATHDRAFT_67869 [Amanita thiersii Skay4041]|uniref:Uncharacterized protein n=1 Tax=Amanita thiersii Skay4041 TaxID=703135 RepID=A0A2A9N9U2_9AGAR|nr:hypothetical protein AMATHDRAFT_67869 [Amanita thiersii Skay4041]
MAFDIGTTYSGASYAVLDPGFVPEIHGVTRFPAQQRVGGDSKIPTIIFYDQEGAVRAVGAEATQDSFLEEAGDEDYVKVEWFKLHLRPRSLPSTHIREEDIPPLPENKTGEEILADFLGYLFRSTRLYIQESHPGGVAFWQSVEQNIDYVLSLPNGWEGAQQAQMRRSAVRAGLVASEAEALKRISFVTEGEASLHFCVQKGVTRGAIEPGEGIIIVDCGGGTIDVSAYVCKAHNSFEEVAPPQCHLEGSVFVSRRARIHLMQKLQGSRYRDDVDHMTNIFDRSTKLSFRNPASPAFIRFGTARDKDLTVDIKSGQMKLSGDDIVKMFKPSVEAIMNAIEEQRLQTTTPIKAVFLVGGFAASDYLFNQVVEQLQPQGLQVTRPDGHLNKAVADGAVSFYLDHFVSVRVANFTYGMECLTSFDPSNPDHVARSGKTIFRPSGRIVIPEYFDVILKKGIRVSEETEFKRSYHVESSVPIKSRTEDILCYRGRKEDPKWVDLEPYMFSPVCTVVADTSSIPESETTQQSLDGMRYYRKEFDIILLFGMTELKAQIAWKESGGVEKRSPAIIVYDSLVEAGA